MKLLVTTFILLFFTFLVQAQPPTANFSANDTEICIGDPVNFTDMSTAGGSPITLRSWDFGDGNSSTATNPSHVYTLPGTYTVTLVATASNGQADPEVKVNYITVNPLPTVGFTTSGNGCTVPFSVTFTNTSQSGAGITYNWTFGNGQTSTSQNPAAVTYNTAGTFPVTLVVTNTTTGCSNSVVQNLVVSNFAASFNAPAQGCVGTAVAFTDMSTVGANSWSWTFGDGQTSSAQNPSISYGAPGTYNVSLTAQNTTSGCSSTFNGTITINPLPTPSFTVNNTTGCAPLNVTFTNTSGAGTFVWDFGNGNTFNGANPPGQSYTSNGTFNPSVTMTDANGCSNVFVFNSIVVSAPIVQFSMDEYNGCAPLTVQFTDLSASPNPGGDPLVTWLWNFGDGSPVSSGQTPPPHVYSEGVYSVTLTVVTQSGCTASLTLTDTIQVGSIQNVNFSVSPIIECAKTPIDFIDMTTYNGNPDPDELTYYWDFGDGGNSTEQSPTYPYPSDTGYFDVTFIVDWRGCKDTLIVPQAVYIKAPISLFTLDQTLFCNPGSLPITLNATDDAIIGQLSDNVEMIWKWGDGTPNSVLSNAMLDGAGNGDISHNYTAYGTYTVEQVVYNYTTGCSDSTTQTIHVSQTTASFTLSNDSTCVGSPITLTSTSTSSHPFGTFSYTTGDGGSTSGNPATYTYNTSGAFDIVLTATNNVGCANTSTFIGLDALALPQSNIVPSDIAGCAPITVSYANGSTPVGNGVPLESFLWTFPDATTQTTSNVATGTQFNFTTEGSFTTSLTTTDEFGCVSSTSVNMSITKPTANFILDDVVCDLEAFTAQNTTTGGVSYEWFVDANPVSVATDYSSSFDEVTNPPSSSVTHNIELIATDANGCKDTIDYDIVVSMPVASFDPNLSGANVNAAGEFTCPPVFANFSDESISYGNIVAWNWSFGDGKTSILQDPSNTYVFPGTYSAGLTITDEYGCTSDTIFVDYLTIFGPTGEPSWTSSGDICGQTFNFGADNLTNVVDIIWNLGDGTTVNDTNDFSHTYGDYGSYGPTATLVDALGCEVIHQLPVIAVIDNGLNAYFVPSPESGPMGTVFVIDDQSTINSTPIVTWQWTVDGTTFTNVNGNDVSQSFGLPGTYYITLIVTDGNGCTNEYTSSVIVNNEFHLPNIITSNGDGTNDFFILPAPIFTTFDIVILNRWGNVIHQDGAGTGVLLWNGLTDNGEKVSDGVYFYKLIGTLVSGDKAEKHGNVTVVNGP